MQRWREASTPEGGKDEIERAFQRWAAPSSPVSPAETQRAADRAIEERLAVGTAPPAADATSAHGHLPTSSFSSPSPSRKARKLARPSVLQLKLHTRYPSLVEPWDAAAPDWPTLLQLKGTRHTVPVPPHWRYKRKYLANKRGLPDHSLAHLHQVVERLKQSLAAGEAVATRRAASYRLREHGDVYQELDEYDPLRGCHHQPGVLSDALRQALVDEAAGLVRYIRSKVTPHDAVPRRPEPRIEFLLDARRHILLHVVLLDSVRGHLERDALPLLRHVHRLDETLSLYHNEVGSARRGLVSPPSVLPDVVRGVGAAGVLAHASSRVALLSDRLARAPGRQRTSWFLGAFARAECRCPHALSFRVQYLW
eukprot:ctg_2380.g513